MLGKTVRSIGIRIHIGKSKVMKVKTDSTANIKVEGKEFGGSRHFHLFRMWSGHDWRYTCTEEGIIKARIGKARGAFVMFNNIWKDMTSSLNTKLRIFNLENC